MDHLSIDRSIDGIEVKIKEILKDFFARFLGDKSWDQEISFETSYYVEGIFTSSGIED